MVLYRDGELVKEDSGSHVATNIIWALVVLAIVGVLTWGVFFSGALNKLAPTEKKVDINVTAPVNR